MTRLLDIGVSGLTAHQRALSTTGQNIANAGVEGYSRQETNFVTRDPQRIGNVFIGGGVSVDTVRRITDEFLVSQSFVDTSRFNELQALSRGIDQLDSLLANEETGLSGSLSGLFNSFQAASESPTSLALRQQVLTSAERFVTRFQAINDQIEFIGGQVDDIIRSQVTEVNQLAREIAELNNQITRASTASSVNQPNDLLDRREILLRQLGEKIGFTTIKDGDGNINVFVAGGEPLVLGFQSSELVLARDGSAGNSLEIALRFNGRDRLITSRLSGGQIGGLLQLQQSGLDAALNQLGLLQTQLSYSVNRLHSEGVDLGGASGGNFFTAIDDRASQLARLEPGVVNASSNTITSVTIDDPSLLTGGDYRLRLSAAGSLTTYQLVRSEDGSVLVQGSITGAFPQTIRIAEGFSIHLEGGDYQGGDEFVIRPSRIASSELDVLVTSEQALAFGLPSTTSASPSNLGDGSISQVEGADLLIDSSQDAAQIAALRAQTPPLVLRFTSPSTYDILDNSDPAQPVQLSPPMRNLQFLPGQPNTILSNGPNDVIYLTSGAFTTMATAGLNGTTTNGNPGETITFTRTDPATGITSNEVVTVLAGESAATAATRINTVAGASARANTELTLTLSDTDPAMALQPRLNGVDLASVALGPVPDPLTTDFLAGRINQQLNASGIVASSDGTTLSIRSLTGEDLNLQMFGAGADTVTITSINGSPAAINYGVDTEVTVAGTVDVTLEENLSLSSSGGFFASSAAQPLPAYLGYGIELAGNPATDDTFFISNDTGEGDNRNALALAALQSADVLSNGSSINDLYAALVGNVGSDAAAARVDSEAAESILTQTQERLSAVSGVNLDEEAALLLQYEQAYNASARVISIARSIFDSLIAAFN